MFVDHDQTDWLRLPRFDDGETQRRLKGTGISRPPVDESLIHRYVETFVVQGYLPRPRG